MEETGYSGQSAPLMAEPRPGSVRHGADQRRGVRYAVHGDAEVFVTGGMSMFRGRIINISSSGCYVQTVAWVRLTPGALVELVFVVKGQVVRARAEARFSESKIGLGLRFVSMDEQMQRRLYGVLAALRSAAAAMVEDRRAERSVLDALTETAAARTDAVLKSERAAEVVDRQACVQRPEEVLEEKQKEAGDEQFSGLEELELDAKGALGEADADVIAAMEEMEAVSRGAELEEMRVHDDRVGGRVLNATR
jgi:PilZ domain